MKCNWDYNHLKQLIGTTSLPAMVVNLDCLDQNIMFMANAADQYDKNIRIATKSIRVPDLIRYIQKKGGTIFKGLMCYSIKEAQYLSSLGFDDLLVAYPALSLDDMEVFYSMIQSGKHIVLMVDCPEHIEFIERFWTTHSSENTYKARICVDIDMSWRPFGLHLGVYRSPIRTLEDFIPVYDRIRQSKNLELTGIMGYEAQIAGMGDRNPFSPLLNPIKRFIKYRSVRDVRKKRALVHDFLKREKYAVSFFNGGGSGSIFTTVEESWITEVTVGSGFLQSHLFDYYKDNQSVPAFCFALQVTRKPQAGFLTCKSGGFIASGETSSDKSPLPFLPEGMKIIGNEGFGEVQTPIKYTGMQEIKLGDPLFFRPAKAGEIAEHFKEYILIREDKIVDHVPTYRGLDLCFY